jgi:hypothetical protein
VSSQLVYLEVLLMLFEFYLKFVYIVEDFHPSLMSRKNKSEFQSKENRRQAVLTNAA